MKVKISRTYLSISYPPSYVPLPSVWYALELIMNQQWSVSVVLTQMVRNQAIDLSLRSKVRCHPFLLPASTFSSVPEVNRELVSKATSYSQLQVF